MARRINFNEVNYRPPPVRNRGEARENVQNAQPRQEARPHNNHNYYEHQFSVHIPPEPTFFEHLKDRYEEIDNSLNNFFDNIEHAIDEADDRINEALDNLFDALKFWR
jgi:archaellum component FlaC